MKKVFISIWVVTILVNCSSEHGKFGIITLAPDFEVNGQGENIDSIGFWEAPDPLNSIMFVTAKGNSLVEVWKYPFINNEQQPLIHQTFANSQVNGVWIDQETDLLYIAVAAPSSTVSVFKLPNLDFVFNFSKAGVDLKSEPNLALLKLATGGKRLYVSADNIVYIHDAITGGEYLGEFTPPHELEAMIADNFYQAIYIPDENDRSGIYAYQPDGAPYLKNGTNRFGDKSILDEDGEGIIVYTVYENNEDTGEGLIVVADQRKEQTDFEIFDRKSWLHLGTLRITGVSNTDGIASTQQSLPDYQQGLFAALNNDRSVACVGWHRILEAINFDRR